MTTIYPVNRRPSLSKEEVFSLVELLHGITEKSFYRVSYLNSCINSKISSQKNYQLKEELNECIIIWGEKMARLGAIPTGLWKVHLTTDEGCYCWQFPDKNVEIL